MVDWGWGKGWALPVSDPLASAIGFGSTRVMWPNREDEIDRIYKSLVFVTEHSFAELPGKPHEMNDPRLHIFDTRRVTTPEDEPVQTSFLFPIDYINTQSASSRSRVATPLYRMKPFFFFFKFKFLSRWAPIWAGRLVIYYTST